jgi:hypothetical protein
LDSKIKPQKRKPNGDWIYPAKENKRKQRLTSNSKKKKWYATPNLTCKCTGLALSLGYRGLDADHRFFFPPSAGRRMVAASALSAGRPRAGHELGGDRRILAVSAASGRCWPRAGRGLGGDRREAGYFSQRKTGDPALHGVSSRERGSWSSTSEKPWRRARR